MPPSKQMKQCYKKGHKMPLRFEVGASMSYSCDRCLELIATPYMTIAKIEEAVVKATSR